MSGELALLALFVGLSFTAQAVTGFGGVVIALTLGALVLPIPELLPLLVPCSLAQTTAILVRGRREIAWRLLLLRVLPLMALGALVGLTLLRSAPGPWLERAFGALVVAIGLRELAQPRPRGAAPAEPGVAPGAAAPPTGALTAAVGTFAAGVIHGVYASGGPMLVAVFRRLGLEKGRFRATLAATWWTLNSSLTAYYVASGLLRAEHLPRLAALAAPLAAAFLIGDWVHHRVDERVFARVVGALLAFAGAVLLLGR